MEDANLEQVTLDGTSVHRLRSEQIGQDYLLNVGLPPGYDPAGAPYPVVYVTDGGAQFTALHSVTPMMQMTGELTPFITVGISYDVPHAIHAMTLRNRDLTHCEGSLDLGAETPDWMKQLPQVEPGGAEHFLSFLNDQVKPYVQEQFNASSNSTYAGFSLGGLFGLFTLFSKPKSFQRYVIGSPSIWWGDKNILLLESAYAKEHDDLPATIYMSSGRLEEPIEAPDKSAMVSNMTNLASTLGSRGYQNLNLFHQIIDDETHMSCAPLAILRGVRKVFG
ncbi:MAG: putative alpha/beta superfamily hydrolase [Candidatus Azotimanducaceae bacterium]|jgi:predicted alpha/beta superfamily hydrolase